MSLTLTSRYQHIWELKELGCSWLLAYEENLHIVAKCEEICQEHLALSQHNINHSIQYAAEQCCCRKIAKVLPRCWPCEPNLWTHPLAHQGGASSVMVLQRSEPTQSTPCLTLALLNVTILPIKHTEESQYFYHFFIIHVYSIQSASDESKHSPNLNTLERPIAIHWHEWCILDGCLRNIKTICENNPLILESMTPKNP